MVLEVAPAQWGEIALGLGATLLLVAAALLIALAWTVPLGVVIGTNRRLAGIRAARGVLRRLGRGWR